MGSRGATLRRVGAGNSAMRSAHVAQYTLSFPLILNHKPPQRSQYFNSNSMIPFSSVSMIFLQRYEFVWSPTTCRSVMNLRAIQKRRLSSTLRIRPEK